MYATVAAAAALAAWDESRKACKTDSPVSRADRRAVERERRLVAKAGAKLSRILRDRVRR